MFYEIVRKNYLIGLAFGLMSGYISQLFVNANNIIDSNNNSVLLGRVLPGLIFSLFLVFIFKINRPFNKKIAFVILGTIAHTVTFYATYFMTFFSTMAGGVVGAAITVLIGCIIGGLLLGLSINATICDFGKKRITKLMMFSMIPSPFLLMFSMHDIFNLKFITGTILISLFYIIWQGLVMAYVGRVIYENSLNDNVPVSNSLVKVVVLMAVIALATYFAAIYFSHIRWV